MRQSAIYALEQPFSVGILQHLDLPTPFALLRAERTHGPLIAWGSIDAIVPEHNCFEALQHWLDQHNDWAVGHLSYDLKNEVENLVSENADGIGFPHLHFFRPAYVLDFREDEVEILWVAEHGSAEEARQIVTQLTARAETHVSNTIAEPIPRLAPVEYLERVSALKDHIRYGNIYETNFCQEFYATDAQLDPAALFAQVDRLTEAPHACFYRLNDRYLLCGSPERFMKKMGSRLISQPIKGTIRRGATASEDNLLREQLQHDPKERSENVMIVDLVRNDLSRTAAPQSVKVDELFGVYSFKTVHQLVSTVSSELRSDVNAVEAIRQAFPMGSMTGAPKVKAMQLAEQYETTKRGLYSGTVGYFTPERDFDFNVVIRALQYNASTQYLSLMVGGAITDRSDPQKEYEECLLKAEALIRALRQPVAL